MSTPERDAALAADQASRDAFRAWQAERGPERRAELKAEYERSTARMVELWEIVGPDPLLSQLAKAQEVEDARPNPDDPDDDGGDA